MNLRPIPLLLAVSTGVSAFGQEPSDPNELMVYEAYSNLQMAKTFQVSLQGTETIAGQTRAFTSNLVWSCGTTAQLTLDDYDTTSSSPRLLRHYVADGRALWSYDFVNHRYSGITYGTYGTAEPDLTQDAPRLLAQLYAESTGPATYLVRLMREVNPPSTASTTTTLVPRYQSWAPGYTPGQPPTEPPVQDPIVTSRYYMNAGNVTYVLYGPNPALFDPAGPADIIPPTRSVAFQLVNSAPPNSAAIYNLETVYFAEVSLNRTVDWTMQITNPVVADPTTFKAYSPSAIAGWQMVPAPKAASS